MSTTKPRTAYSANRLYFIDKNNCRSTFFSLSKKIPYPRRLNSYQHFHKFGSGHRKKSYASFPCNILKGNLGHIGQKLRSPRLTRRKYAGRSYTCLTKNKDEKDNNYSKWQK